MSMQHFRFRIAKPRGKEREKQETKSEKFWKNRGKGEKDRGRPQGSPLRWRGTPGRCAIRRNAGRRGRRPLRGYGPPDRRAIRRNAGRRGDSPGGGNVAAGDKRGWIAGPYGVWRTRSSCPTGYGAPGRRAIRGTHDVNCGRGQGSPLRWNAKSIPR